MKKTSRDITQKKLYWHTTFGDVSIEEKIFLIAGKIYRPFSQRFEVSCRAYSLPLQRAMTDFGADASFAEAAKKMKEHYGIEVPPCMIEKTTLDHAEKIGELGPQERELDGNLRMVEDAFRFMKSDLGMRPIYHQRERRVDGHLWITILAYHLIQNVMHRLRQHGVTEQWRTICNILSTRMRITLQAQTADGRTLHHRSTTKAEEMQIKIYRALGMSPQILKAKKMFL